MPQPQLCLEVKVVSQPPIYLQHPCQLEVILTNADQQNLLINQRLSVGYANTVARELFASLTSATTGEIAPIFEVDYDRNFSPASDYGYLSVGQTLRTTFNLFEWYSPTRVDTYQLILHYQADEPLAQVPTKVVPGTYSSSPILLTVEPSSALMTDL
jgi:hypothetical protein